MSNAATPTLQSAAAFQSTPKPSKRVVVATNAIEYASNGQSQTIRARIDPTLAVSDVVRQLCVSFSITEPPLLYALRSVEDDSLVTDDSLRSTVEAKTPLRLGTSPAITCTTLLATLVDPQTPPSTVKLTLFNLQRYVKEGAFCDEFVEQGGDQELVALVNKLEGNSLAYALQALQALTSTSGRNLSSLSPTFVSDIIAIISSPSSPINISRPATSILRSILPSSGFDVVYASIRDQPAFLQQVVARLTGPEGGECLNSLMLINSLLSAASDGDEFNEFMSDLDKLNVRRDVQTLMAPPHRPDLETALLDFQSNILRATFHLHRSSVDTSSNRVHREMLDEIWSATGLDEDERVRWDLLGLDVQGEGARARVVWKTGRLGLNSFHSFATDADNGLSKLLIEQISKPDDRRCPIGRASNETVEILLEYYEISDYAVSTHFQPLLLSFSYVHSLALRFFLRMWDDSAATADDFGRVSQVVRSQVELVLHDEERVFAKPGELEKGFGGEVAYKAVRERMLKEVEEKDDLLTKVPIRNLRNTLFEECFAFVKAQRIQCMLDGAWFMHGTSVAPYAREPSRNTPRGWTFIRLLSAPAAPNKKSLGYLETQHQHASKPTMEELNERIDLSLISEIALKTSYPTSKTVNVVSFNEKKGDTLRANPSNGSSGGGVLKVASELSFSLLAGGEVSLLDVVTQDRAQFSEWTDGLNLLRSDSARIATKETKELIDQLTDIGLKIRLLDLSGEKVSIPTQLIPPPPPSNVDFFFD